MRALTLTRDRGIWAALLIMGLSGQASVVWAQPIEVDRSIATEVAASLERLVEAAEAHDPELARLIEQEGRACLDDLDDGVLEDPGMTEAVEAVVVAKEAQEQAMAAVATEQLANEIAKVDPQLAAQMNELALGGAAELGGATVDGETINREQAKQVFEQAYSEALTRDPEGAQQMKEMFEAFERGDFQEIVRPTPETMERMQGEMERYFSEHGEGENEFAREYAMREMEQFERVGAGESPEHMREMFERMTPEGHSPEDMERMRTEMERFGQDMERMGHEAMERFHEGDREQFEREFDDRLDLLAEEFGGLPPPPLEGGGGEPPPGGEHTLVAEHTLAQDGHAEGHWDGSDPDTMPDHTHPLGTPTHTQ